MLGVRAAARNPRVALCPRRLNFNCVNLLLAASNKGCNGAIVYVRRLAPLLAARGHKVWVAALPGSWIAGQLRGEVPLLETDFARWPLGESRRVAAFCRDNGITVFHSHLTRASNFGILLQALHGIPSMAHLHTNHPQFHAWFHRRVIAVSGETLARWRRRLVGLGGRGAVLPNFVDMGVYRPAQGRPDALRAALGVGPRVPVVVVLGALSRRKGQDQAAKAWPAVRLAHPEAVLAFIGSGRPGPEHHGEGIAHLGMRGDVPELLPHADVLLVPSRDECMPLAALEGMSSGVPVVAFGVGGLTEMLAEGAGVVVRRGDIDKLSSAVAGLLGDSRARADLASAGLARVSARYAPGPHLELLERHYAEVGDQA